MQIFQKYDIHKICDLIDIRLIDMNILQIISYNVPYQLQISNTQFPLEMCERLCSIRYN